MDRHQRLALIDAAVRDQQRSKGVLAWSIRLTPFFCFTLTGLALDAYATWYFNVVRKCRGEEISYAFDIRDTLMLLIPALTSTIFARDWPYVGVCLVALILYIGMCCQFVEDYDHVQCYKSVGDGLAIIFLLTVLFDIFILIITLMWALLHRAFYYI
jgi:hypothetical protein